MKKFKLQSILMALCLVMTAGLWSCNDEDVDGDGPFLEVLPEKLTFEDTGGAQTLTVKANRAWEAAFVESGLEWVSFTPKKGEGEGTIEVTVLANGGAERTANLKVTSSINSATIRIEQAAAGGSVIGGDPLYQENCGSNVYKINTTTGQEDEDGRWPYVDQYTQYFNPNWEKGGTLDQSGVTYAGSGSNVSNSGSAFAPPVGGPFSGAPYIGMNTASAVFTIENINIDGKTNFTFKFGAIFQANYSGGPEFGTVASNTFTLEASLDGTTWAPLTYTATQESTSDWYMVTSEFKVPAGTAHLSIRYKTANVGSNQGYRFDDFKLYEGGNGELIGEGGGDEPDPTEQLKTIAEVRAHWKGGATAPENGWKITGVVVSNKEGGNIQPYQFALQDSKNSNSGIMINYQKGLANPDYSVGDSVAISLTGATYNPYNGLLQIIITATDKVSKISSGTAPQPLTISVPELKTGNYESMLIAISNVELVDKSVATMGANNGNVDVQSENDQFVMRTGNNAVFKDDPTPKGKGTLIGLGSVFEKNNEVTYQVAPRTKADYAGMESTEFYFGTPTFSATTFKVDEAVVGGKIVIPYENAKGTESYNITVTVGGAAAGITVDAVNPTLTAGSGNIEIPVTGTPTTAGEVTFTINGITSENFTCKGTVAAAISENVLWYETFGEGTKTAINSYAGYLKGGNGVTATTKYSGNGDVRNTSPSKDKYTGASGAGCLFLNKTGGYFLAEKISLNNATSVSLSFGMSTVQPGGTTFSVDDTKFEYSYDGENWMPITYTKENGSWSLVTASPITIEEGKTEISIKITIVTAAQQRIDDITLTKE